MQRSDLGDYGCTVRLWVLVISHPRALHSHQLLFQSSQHACCVAVIITILYFLLALIIALLIAALYMGCNEMEPLAVKLAPAQFTPLLRCAMMCHALLV